MKGGDRSSGFSTAQSPHPFQVTWLMGGWARAVLKKCVFEPKAVGIRSLMHQPSTWHLRSTICCAVSSVLVERCCISSPKILSNSLSVFLVLYFPSFSFLSFSFYSLCHSMAFLNVFHTSCVSCNYPPFPVSLRPALSSSLICLPPLSLPPFSTDQQYGRVCTHCTISSVSHVWFLPSFDLRSFLPLEQWPTLDPCNVNIEQSFNLCYSWHHSLV